MEDNYYEVYMSKDGLSETFLFALKDLTQTEDLITSSYPDFKKVASSQAHPPYIRITTFKWMENPIELYFMKK